MEFDIKLTDWSAEAHSYLWLDGSHATEILHEAIEDNGPNWIDDNLCDGTLLGDNGHYHAHNLPDEVQFKAYGSACLFDDMPEITVKGVKYTVADLGRNAFVDISDLPAPCPEQEVLGHLEANGAKNMLECVTVLNRVTTSFTLHTPGNTDFDIKRLRLVRYGDRVLASVLVYDGVLVPMVGEREQRQTFPNEWTLYGPDAQMLWQETVDYYSYEYQEYHEYHEYDEEDDELEKD